MTKKTKQDRGDVLGRHQGMALREERMRRGLTQLDLAVMSGVSLSTVSLAERRGRPTVATAGRLANVLLADVLRGRKT